MAFVKVTRENNAKSIGDLGGDEKAAFVRNREGRSVVGKLRFVLAASTHLLLCLPFEVAEFDKTSLFLKCRF